MGWPRTIGGGGRCSGSRSSFNVARAPGALACERRACLALDTSPWCTNVSTRYGGPTGFHTMTQRAQTCILEGPALQTPPKFHEKTPNESTKSEILGGRRKKKREILGPHPSLGGPTFQVPPPFGPPIYRGLGPHRAPTLLGPTLRGPHYLATRCSFRSLCRCFCCAFAAAFGPPTVEKPTLAACDLPICGYCFSCCFCCCFLLLLLLAVCCFCYCFWCRF